jgi:hypothetical protein
MSKHEKHEKHEKHGKHHDVQKGHEAIHENQSKGSKKLSHGESRKISGGHDTGSTHTHSRNPQSQQ